LTTRTPHPMHNESRNLLFARHQNADAAGTKTNQHKNVLAHATAISCP
jgi:hypothetical protein